MTPSAATFSLAAPADVAVNVTTPSGITISGIKLGDTTVTKTGHWAFAAGVLTLKSSLLAAYSAGPQVFTVTMSNGDVVTETVTVTA